MSSGTRSITPIQVPREQMQPSPRPRALKRPQFEGRTYSVDPVGGNVSTLIGNNHPLSSPVPSTKNGGEQVQKQEERYPWDDSDDEGDIDCVRIENYDSIQDEQDNNSNDQRWIETQLRRDSMHFNVSRGFSDKPDTRRATGSTLPSFEDRKDTPRGALAQNGGSASQLIREIEKIVLPAYQQNGFVPGVDARAILTKISGFQGSTSPIYPTSASSPRGRRTFSNGILGTRSCFSSVSEHRPETVSISSPQKRKGALRRSLSTFSEHMSNAASHLSPRRDRVSHNLVKGNSSSVVSSRIRAA